MGEDAQLHPLQDPLRVLVYIYYEIVQLLYDNLGTYASYQCKRNVANFASVHCLKIVSYLFEINTVFYIKSLRYFDFIKIYKYFIVNAFRQMIVFNRSFISAALYTYILLAIANVSVVVPPSGLLE